MRKGAKYLSKKIIDGTKGYVQKLIKTLFSVGKENAAPKKSGMKRKTGKLIPVQNNNKARRVQLKGESGKMSWLWQTAASLKGAGIQNSWRSMTHFSFLGGVILLQLFWIPAPFGDKGCHFGIFIVFC